MSTLTSLSPEARARWDTFKDKPGSEHIATPVSLEFLTQYLAERRPARILELGAGIGTLTKLLLEHAAVDAYEDIPFCISELAKNAPGAHVITDYHTLPPAQDYDLVVIDGGNGGKNGGYTEATGVILSYVRPTAVYIEGVRLPQCITTLWALAGRYRVETRAIRGRVIEGRFYKGGTLFTTGPGTQARGALSLAVGLAKLRLEHARLTRRRAPRAP